MQLNGRPIVNYSFVIFSFLLCVFFVGFSVFLYSSVSHSLVEFSFRCACRFDCSRIDQGFLYSLLATRHLSLVTSLASISTLALALAFSLSFSLSLVQNVVFYSQNRFGCRAALALSLPMRRVPFVTITVTF